MSPNLYRVGSARAIARNLLSHRKAGLIIAAVTVLAGILLLKLNVKDVPIGAGLINLSYDLPFNLRKNIWPDEAVIVYLDDQSRSALNQPSNAPWDRSLYAQLLERLTIAGAKAVIFDVLFIDPGSPKADESLAKAMRTCGKVILGAELTTVESGFIDPGDRMASGRALSRPADVFLNSAAGMGLVMHTVDADREVRKHFHGFSLDDPPSIAWAAAELIGAEVTRHPEQRLAPRWINYYGPPGAIPNVSISRVLLRGLPDLPPDFFRGKVVFVGAQPTAGFTGSGRDEFKSPYARGRLTLNLSSPGVEIHATIFLNLLRKDWLRRLPEPIELTLLALAGILFGYGLTLVASPAAVRVALGGAAIISTFAYVLFVNERIWFAWAIPVMVQIPLALFGSLVSNWLDLYVEKRLLEHSLALHLSPKRIKQFVRHPELLKPGAEKQMLSIMFTDVENFTKLSEGMDPDDLARVMNEYFGTTIPCVHQVEGTVIKLIGDAILAVWNAPDPQPNHRELACTAAILLNSKEVRFSGKQSALKLRTRIGIHTGLANVGNFGSTTRIDYTAIGENVNLASRLEGLNKYLGTDILVTRETLEGCSDEIVSRPVGQFRLKGFEKLVEVHDLLGRRDQAEATKSWRDAFARALQEFQRNNFEDAEAGFRHTLEIRPDDGPARFYLQQIADLRIHPPPSDWRGEIELKDK